MIILSENGNKLLDCTSIFIRPIKDADDLNKVRGYKIVGTTYTGRNETLKEVDTEEKAKAILGYIAMSEGSNIPVHYMNAKPDFPANE